MMDRKNELLVRVYFVLFLFILFALIILARVVKITLVEGEKWRSKGEVYVKYMEKEVDRGDIYDANGNLLATSLPFFDIRMDLLVPTNSTFNKNIDSLALCLAQLWPEKKSASQWKSELSLGRMAGKNNNKKGMSYFPIANDVSLDELEKIKSFPLFKEGRYRGGLIVERKSKREKPFREIASRTIGTDRETADKIGIEGSFDKFLRGKTDKQLVRRIPGGYWVPVSNPGELDAKKGDDIVTTLDMHFQDIVHTELLNGLMREQATAGTAILMEVETGAIKAISNLKRNSNGNYTEDYNYAIGRMTEPGSTLKLASMMAMLEDSCIALNDMVKVYGGKKKFYGEMMYDSEPHGKESMTVADVFKKSSNVGIGILADRCYNQNVEGRQKFVQHLRNFGLDKKVEIEIQGEQSPLIKDPIQNKSSFWKTSVPWMAHGYEMHLSPLQILAFYNAVANDGKRMKPFLVQKVLRDGKTLHHFHPKEMDGSIASKTTINKAQELLKGVVQNGTGSNLKTHEFSFAGKTGTTRVNYHMKDRRKEYNASFAGYFPAENPKYSLIVVIYDPKVAYYGGRVAGVPFRNIAEKCHSFFYEKDYPEHREESEILEDFMVTKEQSGYAGDYDDLMAYMDVEYEKNTKGRWVDLRPFENDVILEKKQILKSQVPDVRGMGLRDATYVLESLGLKVRVEGIGKISQQSIKPGTENNGQEIELYLN